MNDLNPLAQYVGNVVPDRWYHKPQYSATPNQSLTAFEHREELDGLIEENSDRIPRKESALTKKYRKMTAELCDVLNDFG
jgi:hypothetical protein